MLIERCRGHGVRVLLALVLSAWATSVRSAPVAGKEKAPIAEGQNLLAAACVNDSPGSSDMTLIIQIKVDGKIVLDEGHPCRATVPTQNIPSDKDPTGWTKPGFDDSKWQEGRYGIGYGDADDNFVIGDGQHAMIYSRRLRDQSSGVRQDRRTRCGLG
jgi:hypothetical protein